MVSGMAGRIELGSPRFALGIPGRTLQFPAATFFPPLCVRFSYSLGYLRRPRTSWVVLQFPLLTFSDSIELKHGKGGVRRSAAFFVFAGHGDQMHPGSLGRASPVWRRASKMGSLITVFYLRSNAYALFHWVPVVSRSFELRDAWKCRAGRRGNRSQADEVKVRGAIPFLRLLRSIVSFVTVGVQGSVGWTCLGKGKAGVGRNEN